MEAAKVSADTVTLGYTGLDHRLRETYVRFDPRPRSLSADRAEYSLDVAPGETVLLFVETGCSGLPPATDGRRAFLSAFIAARRGLRAQSSRAASVTTSNQILNEAICRSVSGW